MLFFRAGNGVNRLLAYAFVGSEFVFGELGKQRSSIGFIFAFQVLPTIIFIASLFALLYYLGVMQVVIRAAAWVMQRVMGASGAESLNVAASIFMGQTEAPLTIRPFLPDLTQSELMTIMTSGMAHVSGGIMAAYIAFGVEARHLLTAVIMTAPGTLLISKMLVPETEEPKTMGVVHMEHVEHDSNFLGGHRARDGRRAGDGDKRGGDADRVSGADRAHQRHHGRNSQFSGRARHDVVSVEPAANFRLGVCAGGVRSLACRGMIACRSAICWARAWWSTNWWHFRMLGPMKGALDPRSFTIATFALCGFANFSSIGMQIGGIGALAPNLKSQLAKFGIRAMLAGTMANLMSASIVGMFLK